LLVIINLLNEKLKTALSITREIETGGHSPLEVITTDFKKYIVKTGQGKEPPYYLISELLCQQFLSLWKIPTPEVDIINIDRSIIQINLSDKHKLFHFDKPCFGSEVLAPMVEVTKFTELTGKKSLKRIVNPVDFFKIALFDIWVENDDRKPGNYNLLFRAEPKNRYQIYAIDHAFTFTTQNYDQLDPTYGVTNTFNDSILYGPIAKPLFGIVRAYNIDWRQYFYESVNACEKNFVKIVQNLPEDFKLNANITAKLAEFLFHTERNGQVIQEFYSRLK
jgi:hypothetical protein